MSAGDGYVWRHGRPAPLPLEESEAVATAGRHDWRPELLDGPPVWTPQLTAIRAAHWPAHGIKARYLRFPWNSYPVCGDMIASVRAALAVAERQRRDDELMEYLDDFGDSEDYA